MSQNETDSNVVKVPLEEVEYCWKRTPGGEIQRVFTCDFWKGKDDWKSGIDWRKVPVALLQKRAEEIDNGQGRVVCPLGKLKNFGEDGKEAEKRPYIDPDILARKDRNWNGMDWDSFTESDPRWREWLSKPSSLEIYNTWISHQFDPNMGAFEPFSGAQAQWNAARKFEDESAWLQLIRDNAGADFPPLGSKVEMFEESIPKEEIELD
ncbi:MAG: hypothetical protein J6P10_00290 [Aeriscardovia sp.]|nr:hypothetical protein [Aeriscardovia sp.]